MLYTVVKPSWYRHPTQPVEDYLSSYPAEGLQFHANTAKEAVELASTFYCGRTTPAAGCIRETLQKEVATQLVVTPSKVQINRCLSLIEKDVKKTLSKLSYRYFPGRALPHCILMDGTVSLRYCTKEEADDLLRQHTLEVLAETSIRVILQTKAHNDNNSD